MADTRERLMKTTDALEATLIIDRDWDRLGSTAGIRTIICAMGGFRDSLTVQRASIQGLTQLSTRTAMLKAIVTSGGISAVISAMNRYRRDEALQALGLEFLAAVALRYLLDPEQVAREFWYETVARSMEAHPRSDDVRLYGSQALCALLSTDAPPPRTLLSQLKRVLLACLGRARTPRSNNVVQNKGKQFRRKKSQQKQQQLQQTQQQQLEMNKDVQRHALFALAILTKRTSLTGPSDFLSVINAMEQYADDLELQSSSITILSNSLRDISSSSSTPITPVSSILDHSITTPISSNLTSTTSSITQISSTSDQTQTTTTTTTTTTSDSNSSITNQSIITPTTSISSTTAITTNQSSNQPTNQLTTTIGNIIAGTKTVESIAAAFRKFRGPQYRSSRLACCSALISLLHISPALRSRAITSGVFDTALSVAVAGASGSGEGDIGAIACALLALLAGDDTTLTEKQLERATETLLGVLRANTESEALQNIGCYALRCTARRERVKDRVVALGGPALLAEILVACPHPYPAEALAQLVIGANAQSRKEAIAAVKSHPVLEAVAAAAARCPDVLPPAALFFKKMFACDDVFFQKIEGRGKLGYRGANQNVRRVMELMERREDPRAAKAREEGLCSKRVAGEKEEMCQKFKRCASCGGVLVCESCWKSGCHKDHDCVDFFAIGICSN